MVLLIHLVVLIASVLVAPLQYIRTDVSTTLDEAIGVLTIETAESCQGANNGSLSQGKLSKLYVGRNQCDLVQGEGNIRSLSRTEICCPRINLHLCELLLLGLSIFACLLACLCWMRLNGQWCLIAIQESGEARYLVIAGVIFLTDNGVLVVIFIPKIKYAKVGITRWSRKER